MHTEILYKSCFFAFQTKTLPDLLFCLPHKQYCGRVFLRGCARVAFVFNVVLTQPHRLHCNAIKPEVWGWSKDTVNTWKSWNLPLQSCLFTAFLFLFSVMLSLPHVSDENLLLPSCMKNSFPPMEHGHLPSAYFRDYECSTGHKLSLLSYTMSRAVVVLLNIGWKFGTEIMGWKIQWMCPECMDNTGSLISIQQALDVKRNSKLKPDHRFL